MPSYYDSKGGKPGKKKRVYKKGGKVENGHDITYARGSGAARPQIFRKYG